MLTGFGFTVLFVCFACWLFNGLYFVVYFGVVRLMLVSLLWVNLLFACAFFLFG